MAIEGSEAQPPMRKVSIIQREIPHYRVRFFEELYAQGRLQELDIQVYTGALPAQATSSPAFPYQVLPVRHFGKMKSGSYWMYGLEKAITGSDIVVAPQELQCLTRSEEHTSELQSLAYLVCRLLLEKKKYQ